MSKYTNCNICGKTVSEQGLQAHCDAKHGGARMPVCPYCDEESSLVGGDGVYPHRKDLAHKRFYVCHSCGARVGCHPGTSKPLGRLANDELRKLKMACHANFDPIWREFKNAGYAGARHKAYAWLAERLSSERSECHFGMMDEARAKASLAILRNDHDQLEAYLDKLWHASMERAA